MAERHPTYDLIKNDDATSRFFMNEVAFLVFGNGGKRYHLTEALNGCFAVFLISPLATVSAHIPPHPGVNYDDPQAGDKNLIVKMQEFAAKYKANESYFRGYKVALIYAVLHGKTQLPDKKEFIEKCLRKLHVDFPLQDYEVKPFGHHRPAEHGTAFVDGKSPTGPALYLQDKMVLRVFTLSSEKSGVPKPAETRQPKPTPRQADVETLATHTNSSGLYTNPIFGPRGNSGSVPTPTIAQEFHRSNPMVSQYTISKSPTSTPQTSTVNQAEKKLNYVRSQLDHGKGGRIVIIGGRTAFIKHEYWKADVIDGKKVWASKKFGVFTDFKDRE